MTADALLCCVSSALVAKVGCIQMPDLPRGVKELLVELTIACGRIDYCCLMYSYLLIPILAEVVAAKVLAANVWVKLPRGDCICCGGCQLCEVLVAGW